MMYSRGIIDSIEDGIVRIENEGADKYVPVEEFQGEIIEGAEVVYDHGWKVIRKLEKNKERFEALKRKKG